MKILKILSYTGLLALITLFSACFEIEETVKINSDGSGTYTNIADISAMMSLLEMYDEMEDSSESDNSVGEIFQTPSEILESLAQLPGISNVQDLNDSVSKKLGYSFDFVSIEALNHALELNKNSKSLVSEFMHISYPAEQFKIKGKKFKRNAPQGSTAMDLSEEDELSMQMVEDYMKDMKLTVTYQFDRKIKKAKPALGNLSPDKMAYSVVYSYEMMKEAADNMGIFIKLK